MKTLGKAGEGEKKKGMLITRLEGWGEEIAQSKASREASGSYDDEEEGF